MTIEGRRKSTAQNEISENIKIKFGKKTSRKNYNKLMFVQVEVKANKWKLTFYRTLQMVCNEFLVQFVGHLLWKTNRIFDDNGLLWLFVGMVGQEKLTNNTVMSRKLIFSVQERKLTRYGTEI
jgi:hypothetical protein